MSHNPDQESSVPLFQIDGKLSAEEKIAFAEAMQRDTVELSNNTCSSLDDFVMTDLFAASLENQDATQISQIREKLLWTPGPFDKDLSMAIVNLQKEMGWDITGMAEADLLEKLQIQDMLDVEVPDDLSQELAKLNEGWANLSVEKAIWDLTWYITDNVKLPAWSNISQEDYRAIIEQMWVCINEDFQNIYSSLLTSQRDNDHLGIFEMRHILNTNIQEVFNETRNYLIPSVQVLLETSSPEWRSALEVSLMKKATDKWEPHRWVESDIDHKIQVEYNTLLKRADNHRMLMLEALLDGDVTESSDLDGLYTSELDFQLEEHSRRADNDVDVSFLSEVDKKIEAEAMMYYMCAVWVQCVPYIGAIPSLTINAIDAFSSSDTTLDGLKKVNLVGKDFNIEKWTTDNILAGLWFGAWLVLSALWIQALVKSWKIAKAVKGIKNLDSASIPWMIDKFASTIPWWEKIKSVLKQVLGFGEQSIEKWADGVRARRTSYETSEAFEKIPWVEKWELWFVDDTWMLHINLEELNRPKINISEANELKQFGMTDNMITKFNNQEKLNPEEIQQLKDAGNPQGFIDFYTDNSKGDKMKLLVSERRREFLAHEVAHIRISDLPAWSIGHIGTMLENYHLRDPENIANLFSPEFLKRYDVNFRDGINADEKASELVATMVGRSRAGKPVPQEFHTIMENLWYRTFNDKTGQKDYTEFFGVETNRKAWERSGWQVENPDNIWALAKKGWEIDAEIVSGLQSSRAMKVSTESPSIASIFNSKNIDELETAIVNMNPHDIAIFRDVDANFDKISVDFIERSEKLAEKLGLKSPTKWWDSDDKKWGYWVELWTAQIDQLTDFFTQTQKKLWWGKAIENTWDIASQVSAATQKQPLRNIVWVDPDITKNHTNHLEWYLDDLDKLVWLLPDSPDSDIAIDVWNIGKIFGKRIPDKFIENSALNITAWNIAEFRDAVKKIDADFSQEVTTAKKLKLESAKTWEVLEKAHAKLETALTNGNPEDLKQACWDFIKQLSTLKDISPDIQIARLSKTMFQNLTEAYSAVDAKWYKEVMYEMKRSREKGPDSITYIIKWAHQKQFLQVLNWLSS